LQNGAAAPKPIYLSLPILEIRERARRALDRLSRCTICPRVCLVDRTSGDLGFCRTDRRARVASYFPHHGEEPPISGWRGSGTIFFSGCNLACVYCQNSEISQSREGQEVTDEQLAAIMLRLQSMGCHNVNLVSPSHVVPQFLSALALAVEEGFRLPIVYNTGGYDSLASLRLLDGIVDIYMPDAKYGDDRVAQRLSGIREYVQVNRKAILEMHRQVGDLQLGEDGIATRGLLVRHLVLPERLAGTPRVVQFLASDVSANSYVNIMAQYRPCFRALGDRQLGRTITAREYREAIAAARSAGLRRGLPDMG